MGVYAKALKKATDTFQMASSKVKKGLNTLSKGKEDIKVNKVAGKSDVIDTKITTTTEKPSSNLIKSTPAKDSLSGSFLKGSAKVTGGVALVGAGLSGVAYVGSKALGSVREEWNKTPSQIQDRVNLENTTDYLDLLDRYNNYQSGLGSDIGANSLESLGFNPFGRDSSDVSDEAELEKGKALKYSSWALLGAVALGGAYLYSKYKKRGRAYLYSKYKKRK